MWRGGTEQNLRFCRSVTKAENEFRGTQFPPTDTELNEISNLAEAWRKRGGTVLPGGHGTEQNFKFGGSVVEAWRNGPPQWTRNVIKIEVWRERVGTALLGGHGTWKIVGSMAERYPVLSRSI